MTNPNQEIIEPGTRYRALVALDFNETHLDAGDVSDEIPVRSVAWLLQDKLIELVKE